MNKSRDPWEKTRTRIGGRVRELRNQRLLTQAEVAAKLHVSQGRLSEIERGLGSLTAEQFLTVLKLFNASAAEFETSRPDANASLQNALARLGADHIEEATGVLPSAHLAGVVDAIRETLLLGTPRLVTGLAPVLTRHVDSVNLQTLYAQLAHIGLERRLGWLVENTLLAIRERLAGSPPRPWTRSYRRAEVVLQSFFEFIVSSHSARLFDRPFEAPDILDDGIRTTETLNAVSEAASEPSRRWKVVTRLQPGDFAAALGAVDSND